MPALTGWHFCLRNCSGYETSRMERVFQTRRRPETHEKEKTNENEKWDIFAVIARYQKIVEMALTAIRFGVGERRPFPVIQ